jgi:hypothetical protein
MLIYLDECRKSVLTTLIEKSNETNRKRLHFKKSELSSVFNMEYDLADNVIYELWVLRFIDVPFENNKQIDIIIFKDMIEEQLLKNETYVRKFKDWNEATPSSSPNDKDGDIGDENIS